MEKGAGRKVGSRFFGAHRKNRRAPFGVLISTAPAPANVFGKYVSLCPRAAASNPTQQKLRLRNPQPEVFSKPKVP